MSGRQRRGRSRSARGPTQRLPTAAKKGAQGALARSARPCVYCVPRRGVSWCGEKKYGSSGGGEVRKTPATTFASACLAGDVSATAAYVNMFYK